MWSDIGILIVELFLRSYGSYTECYLIMYTNKGARSHSTIDIITETLIIRHDTEVLFNGSNFGMLLSITIYPMHVMHFARCNIVTVELLPRIFITLQW